MAEQARTHDFTQGFGSFDFTIPPDPEEIDDLDSESEFNWKIRWLNVRPKEVPSNPQPRESSFPFLRLPLEIRRKIYRCFTDALVGGGEAHLDARQLRKGVRFLESDRGWDEEVTHKGRNYVYQVTIPEPPSQRNADTRSPMEDPRRVDILDIYTRIQRDELAEDEAPTGWAPTEGTRGFMLRHRVPEDEQALSDDTESSDGSWTSDNAMMTYLGDDIDADDEDPEVVADIGQLRLHRPRCPMKIGLVAANPQCCVHNFHPPGKKGAPKDCFCSKLALHSHDDGEFRCQDEDACCRTWEDMLAACKNLRLLAQVSPQITHELGQVLWDNSSIEFKGPQFFLDFAAERPAAVPLVRGIVLNVDLNGFPAMDTQTHELESMLGFVSEHCNLRSFAVKLWTDYRAAPEDCSKLDIRVRDKLAEWAPLFRALRTSTFDVQPFILKYKPYPDMTEVMREKYIEIVRTARCEWTPDCMREETAEGAYMRERAEWLGQKQQKQLPTRLV